MGVPGFFAWIVKKYPMNILLETPSESIDALYLDWNGGIHPVCRSLLTKYKGVQTMSTIDIEDEMITEMLKYLHHVVSYNPPQDLLYIAIDGIAPRAKMNQQRSRRFKAAKDKEIINNIKKRHNEPLDYQWDTNAITPGTPFMKKLCSRLSDAITTDEFFTNAQFRTILSDASTPMEGEHKIMAHIRQNPNNKCAIYGLDADLIFLSLLSSSTIWLMRERDQFGDVRGRKPFGFMDINALRCKLIGEIYSVIGETVRLDERQIIEDFIVCCFLLGNDFLPKAPCLFIHDGGIEHLISVYSMALETTKQSLTSTGEINYAVLCVMLEHLGQTEGFRLHAYHRKNAHRFTPRANALPVDVELAEYDAIWPHSEDNVKLGKQGWKDRYYQHFFGFDRIVDKRKTDQIIGNYLKTMNWILKYYIEGLPSWEWFYCYHHAPILSDVANYLKKYRNTIRVRFEMSSPVEPCVQLLCVLPPQSFSLIEPKLREYIVSKNLPYFPLEFDEDCVHKKKRWQTIPNIPFVNVQTIVNTLREFRESC